MVHGTIRDVTLIELIRPSSQVTVPARKDPAASADGGARHRQRPGDAQRINGAKISGAYFPAELTASEIELSLLHGTRMRYHSKT